jgi:serine protease Do
MKTGMILNLILALGLLGGSCMATGLQPLDPQQGDDWGVTARGSYLGVRTQDISHERMSALKLKDETGVEVVMVDQDAPAAKAGIKEHDVLLSFNGTRVESEEQLRRVVRETPPGRTVAVGLLRDGQPVNLNVTLANRKEMVMARKGSILAMPPVASHPNVPMMPMMDFDAPQVNVFVQSTGRNGIMVEGITPQLAEYFGCRNGATGVLVRSVERGSPGETAGLRAGDIILQVDKDKIADPGDWRHALRGRSGNISLTILRDKKEQTLNLALPEKRGALELPDFDFPNVDIENAMRGLQDELKNIRPLIDQNREQLQMIAKQMQAPNGEVYKQIQRAQEEARKSMENIKIDLAVTY